MWSWPVSTRSTLNSSKIGFQSSRSAASSAALGRGEDRVVKGEDRPALAIFGENFSQPGNLLGLTLVGIQGDNPGALVVENIHRFLEPGRTVARQSKLRSPVTAERAHPRVGQAIAQRRIVGFTIDEVGEGETGERGESGIHRREEFAGIEGG